MGKYNLVEVDLKPLAKVANNLIDKLADAVGWVADRKSLQQQAVDMFIKDIQEKEKDPLKKAAYVSNARKIVKEYQRQQNIVKIALSSLSDTAQPDKLAMTGLFSIWINPGMFVPKNFNGFGVRYWLSDGTLWEAKTAL